MASVTSMSSGTQSNLDQLRVRQAVRSANQAEANAEALKVQAADAQNRANQAQAYADSVATQSAQAQTVAGVTRLQVTSLSSEQQVVSQVGNTAGPSIAVQRPVATTASISGPVAPGPVMNSLGQLTGKINNTHS